MSLSKRAAVRGIVHELVRRGLASFPSKEAADEVADTVADAAQGMPDVAPEEGHDPQQVLEVAMKLREIADQLMAQAGAGAAPGAMPPGAMPPGAAEAGAAELGKTSASMDYETAAYYGAADALDKIAAEEMHKAANPQGALVGPGQEHHNTPAAAAQTDTVAAMDEKHRPQGEHQIPRGETNLPSNQVGELKPNPQQPSNSPSGGNSLTADVHKTSSVALARKVANALIGQPGDHKNTAAAAAAVDTVAKLDQAQRPEGYAHVGQGNANFSEPAAARVGEEKKHPNAPAAIPGTNSVQAASKTGSYEEMFEALFNKTAEEVRDQLPASLEPEKKTAAIRQMMGLMGEERVSYLAELNKMAGEHKADCDCGPCKDKKKGSDGGGDLMARLHSIANKTDKK